MTKSFKVKEFSELTDVTIRTLHYYDNIGLLQPKQKMASGYRLYSEMDMMRLQQILTLRFLGLSLAQIKKIIDAENIDLLNALQMQSTALNQRVEEIQMASRLLKQMVENLQEKRPIQWKNNLNLIKVMKMNENDIETWCQEYLSQEEYAELKNLKGQFNEEFFERYNQRWKALMNECAKHKHEDPKGKIGQQFAKRGWQLITEVWGNNLELSRKLWEATKAGAPTRKSVDVDDKTLEFFDKALKYYRSQQGK